MTVKETRQGFEFINWGRNVRSSPEAFEQPSSTSRVVDVVNTVRRRGGSLRVVGAGHSWSGVAATDDTLVNLDRMNKVISVDRENLEVTVEAGIRLADLCAELNKRGLALLNLGSVTEQSIAGAASTGTHGSGLAYGNIATQIRAMKLVNGLGEVVRIKRDDPRLEAARLSLGMLGVITELTLEVEPTYNVLESTFSLPFESALELAPVFYENHPRVKFWWLPHTGVVQVFTYDKTDEQAQESVFGERLDGAVNDYIFAAILKAGEKVSGLVPALNRVVGSSYFKSGSRVARWDKGLTLAMPPVHREAEYGVPVAHTAEMMRRTRELIERHKLTVAFINEVRFVGKDEAWLSGSYQRDTCQFGAYTSNNRHAERFIRGVEDIAYELGGRPHWGKEFEATPEYLESVFPRYRDFCELRAEMDPDGVFANDFVRKYFPGGS